MSEESTGQLGHLRILIVEDSDTDYLLLNRQIGKLLNPDACTRVSNRQELMAALPESWALILTDYHLPDIEGQELLESIAESNPTTPCFVLSGAAYALDKAAMPRNVVNTLDKGDLPGIQAALKGDWRSFS